MIDVPERVAYTQLAEECTELAHAALKLGRKADPEQNFAMGDADYSRWIGNLYEEIGDVMACLDALKQFLPFGAEEQIEEIRKQKLERWEARLKK